MENEYHFEIKISVLGFNQAGKSEFIKVLSKALLSNVSLSKSGKLFKKFNYQSRSV